MKVKFSVVRIGDRNKIEPRKIFRFKIEEVTYCCEAMKHSIEDLGNIAINSENVEDHQVPYVSTLETGTREGQSWVNFYPIKFCPFCGNGAEYQKDKEYKLKEKHQQVEKIIVSTVKDKVMTDELIFEEIPSEEI